MPVRFRAALAALLVTSSAQAFVPRSGPKFPADTLTAMPAATGGKPLRVQQHVLWGQAAPSPGWLAFQAAAGGHWQAAWDAATGVPTRIWGSGIPAPGAIASPAAAEAFARKVLADQVALLAPGASASDFELVSNVYDGNIRALGFVQRAGGLRVVGGQISFEFKHDRLFVIGSEALPNVHVATALAHLAVTDLQTRAATAVRAAIGLPSAPVSSLGPDVILPLVADDSVLGYRVVAAVELDGGADGRYRAYADVTTGALVAVQQLNEYATGTVFYAGVNRYPGRGYVDRPVPNVHLTVNGGPQTTMPDGTISWSPDAPVPVVTSTGGDLVTIVDKSMTGSLVSSTLSMLPGGWILWDETGDSESDAQVDAYLDTNIAKQYIRDRVDANMQTLNDQMTVNVNLNQTCNAFFDGKALNFFAASPPSSSCTTHQNSCCENTARIQDVNFHEYGHRVHTAEIIMGVGDFDGAMSEGVADFLAASINNDSGMGRGFFFTDDPLRELDPPGSEWSWPGDIGEIHHTGMIIGGTLWDLRKAFIAQYGADAGELLTNKIYVGVLRRSINIPTTLIEALATDDDDGDLSNGTPHECAIRDAWGRHGLRTATGTIEAPGALATDAAAIGIAIDVSGLSGRCQGDVVVGATLKWVPPYSDALPQRGSVDATPAGPNRFYAELPLSPHDSVYYQAVVTFSDGSTMVLPDNLADPFYQLYQGFTIPLYCTDFEQADPLSTGWTTGTDDGSPSPWKWSTSPAGPTDPPAAFSGTHIFSMTPGANYAPSQHSWVQMPEISVGQYSDVRLQYRRWLGVEDSHFDQARILINSQRAWINFTQMMGDSSSIAHIDKEWRFQDVPLSAYITDKKARVAWDLKSDAGLEYGGWALDDVCIVANPQSICGDGVKSPSEACDNGLANADQPDLCRTNCRLPTCGDGIVDTGEQCDDGPTGSAKCSAQCMIQDAGQGSGCCSTSGGGASSLLLAGAVAGLLTRSGRTRARRSRAR
jgi:cysteine-rich repeat protein